ncbi:MAG: DUF308 domain-containing protein [Thermomicrobiales bacterium]
MVAKLVDRWWLFLVQGIVMIVMAVLAVTNPTTILTFIGAYAIIDGIIKLISGFGDQPADRSRWPALAAGALSVLAGLFIIFYPTAAAQALVYVISVWAIVVGIFLALWAIRLREEISDEWTLLLLALLSIIFGVLALMNVPDGFLALRSLFSAYMILGGVLAIILALRVRSLGEQMAARR